jgi:hypothetical protein
MNCLLMPYIGIESDCNWLIVHHGGGNAVFPRLLATTRVLPDADSVGFPRSITIQRLLPLISTVIAMVISPVHLLVDCLAE